MSRRLVMGLALLVAPSAAAAQDYGPQLADPDEGKPVLTEAEPCEETVQEDGVIVVCRELPESERYLSPIRKPVESDRRTIPGMTDPPCWVTNPAALGTPSCIRFGWVPEPAIMVDTTAFPEELSEEVKARIVVVDDPEDRTTSRIGERIPIDLSED